MGSWVFFAPGKVIFTKIRKKYFIDSLYPPLGGGGGGGGCIPPSHSSSHISILLEIMNDNLINITKFLYSHPRVAHIADTGLINLL